MVPLHSFLKSSKVSLVLHHLTYCCKFFILQLSIILLRSIHSPITLMSSFAAQLIFDSTFNLYRRFNTNFYSIFKYHCIIYILCLFSTLFRMYFNSTLHSCNCFNSSIFWDFDLNLISFFKITHFINNYKRLQHT